MQTAIVLLRSRLPALCLAALFNVALIALLLLAMPKLTTPPVPETQVVFVPLPLLEPARKPEHRQRRPGASPNAITLPYFNPYTFNPRAVLPPAGAQRLSLALATCAPENYDRQSDEVRAACAKIQTALAYDKEHFGVNTDIAFGPFWERELLRRKTPYLAPCMTPGGPDVIYLLTCVYQVLFTGYDSEKAPHY